MSVSKNEMIRFLFVFLLKTYHTNVRREDKSTQRGGCSKNHGFNLFLMYF
jgi:hypothetical protein